MTEYNGTSITYDEIGNPNNWHNVASFAWEKRELNSLTLNDGANISFTYTSDGIRKQKYYSSSTKTVNHTYTLDGNKIIKEAISSFSSTSTSTDILYYLYDASGSIQGFIYNNDYYYFQKNLQGDVIRILDQASNVVTEYTYDAWGKVLSVTGTLADTIGQLNPFRYRGYYYDTETGFYYLQSRYYDPSVGRFINADGQIASVSNSVHGYNLFAYCFNNPISFDDSEGNWPILSAVFCAVKVVVAVVVVAVTYACVKNCISSQKEPDYDAVDTLLEDKKVTAGNVELPEDTEGLLYNKENREYASEIIKEELGPDTIRTEENISSEIFAHQFFADVAKPLQLLSGIVPQKYDVYGRLAKADIDEKENRISFFNTVEMMFEWE